jgi:hypothetical protein
VTKLYIFVWFTGGLIIGLTLMAVVCLPFLLPGYQHGVWLWDGTRLGVY